MSIRDLQAIDVHAHYGLCKRGGEQNSLPEDFVQFANDFPTVNIILAHLGFGFDDDPTHQVRALQAGLSRLAAVLIPQ